MVMEPISNKSRSHPVPTKKTIPLKPIIPLPKTIINQQRPTIIVTSPKRDERKTNNEKIKLRFVVIDDAVSLAGGPEIFLSNEIIKNTQGTEIVALKKKTANEENNRVFEAEVPLKVGENTIQINVASRSGLRTSEIVKINRIRENIFYDKSLAVVIGIDDYQYWPQLRNAFSDAQEMEHLLKDLGFSVYTLYNQKATKDAIQNMISEKIANKASKGDRVLVFFAGYGQTHELSDGELDYIVPVEGKTSQYGTFISMTDLRDWCRLIPAKHLFFIMDSYYSGLGLMATRLQETGSETKTYLKEKTRHKAGKIHTVGQREQQPSDDSNYAHSVFTSNLIQGIRNQTADLNEDGIITSTELGGYLKEKIFRDSNHQQMPDFGPLTGHDSGEFVFKFPQDYLKGD
jgi:hypothetical protein